MTQVTKERMMGNYAVAHVSKLLSRHCLVRPVASDTDVGVDLYCETVHRVEGADHGQPFLHFWVQVKSGKQIRELRTQDGIASCSFDCDHLRYWKRQPVPVFAALVPFEWPSDSEPDMYPDPDVYVVDVTRKLLRAEVDLRQGEAALRSDYHWPSPPGNMVRWLVEDEVPAVTAFLQIQRGVIAHEASLEEQYVKTMAEVPVRNFTAAIEQQLRRTAAFAPILLVHDGRRGPLDQYAEFCKRVARIAACFVGDTHWETSAAQAISKHIDKDYKAAAELYQRAIESIDADRQAPERSFQHTRNVLMSWRVLAAAQLPLDPPQSGPTGANPASGPIAATGPSGP